MASRSSKLARKISFNDVVCLERCLRRAARERDLAGRARNAPRGRRRQAAGLRSHSRPACCEVPRVLRRQARHTAAGRDSLSGCALRQVAGCTGRAPRKWSPDATRRRDPACKRPKAVLRPAAHPQPRIRAGVCRQQLTQGKPWPCPAWMRSARGRAASAQSRPSAFLLCVPITKLTARPAEIFR
jgi:hypothetical protein